MDNDKRRAFNDGLMLEMGDQLCLTDLAVGLIAWSVLAV